MGVIERTRNVSLEMRGQDIVGVKTWEGSIRTPLAALADYHWQLKRHERAKTQKQVGLMGRLLASKAMILQDLGPFPVPQNYLPREKVSRLEL